MAGLALLPAPARSSAQMRNCAAKAGRFSDQVASEPPSPCTKTTCGALTGPAIRQWVTMPPTSTSLSSTSSVEVAFASSAARSTSSRPIMPPGPVPTRVARSTPSSCASRRAAGEALTRPPALTGALAESWFRVLAALPASGCLFNASPCWTVSPGCFSHATTSPVFIASPHLGILTIVAMLHLLSRATLPERSLRSRRALRVNLSQNLLDGGNNTLRTGHVELLKGWAEWHRRMWRRDPLDRRIELGEGFLDNERSDICGGAAPWIVLVNNHQAMRLGDRGENRFLI